MKSRSLLFSILALLLPLIAEAAEPPAVTTLAKAKTAFDGNNLDEALGLYERVFSESRSMDDWFNAQKGIVSTLAKKGALPEALQAAKICLDGAPTLWQFDAAVQITANLVSALDRDVKRANEFLEFQRTGTGTNVMDQIQYPALPERERLFEALRNEAGDTPASSRMRAWTFLYCGKPNDGVAQLADGFRRASAAQDLQTAGSDLINVALRIVRRNAAEIENEIAFVISGPAGPDGQAGTPDDLKDPFAAFPTPPPEGQGGLAGLPPAQLDALRKIRSSAMLYAGDERMRPELRREALNALQRANDALDNWGEAGQQDWYLQLALGPEGSAAEDPLLNGAQAAAKGRKLNLGGIVILWKQISDHTQAKGIVPSKSMERSRKQFESTCSALGKIKPRKLAWKDLTKPATF